MNYKTLNTLFNPVCVKVWLHGRLNVIIISSGGEKERHGQNQGSGLFIHQPSDLNKFNVRTTEFFFLSLKKKKKVKQTLL